MTVIAWFMQLFIRCFFPGYGHTDTLSLDDVRGIYCGKKAGS